MVHVIGATVIKVYESEKEVPRPFEVRIIYCAAIAFILAQRLLCLQGTLINTYPATCTSLADCGLSGAQLQAAMRANPNKGKSCNRFFFFKCIFIAVIQVINGRVTVYPSEQAVPNRNLVCLCWLVSSKIYS